MIIDREAIEGALRTEWSQATLTADPIPVTGGEWATMLRLEVGGVPDGVPSDLVLRLAPHAEMAAKEVAVQLAAADGGVSTPTIRMSGPPGGPLGEAWSIMDFAPGAPLLANLDGLAALPRLPGIARRLPVALASSMAEVHQLDPGSISAAVRHVAPNTALAVDDLLPHLHIGAQTADRPDLAAALQRLGDTQPTSSGLVVCHGDIHPLNLLADGDRLTVLDWTGALIAPPTYDVAWTWLLLRFPPMAVPAALRPVIDRVGRSLSSRFLHAYRAAAPAHQLEDLDWFQALHSCRVLIDLALWEAAGDPRAQTHPARLTAPGASELLARVAAPTLGP